MTDNTILLVDGSSYLFRAYYALPPLSNSRGEQTGAVYGVMNMLRQLPKKFATSHIAIVFDSKGKTFRHKMYPEYKANRAAMPEDLQEQIKPLHKLIRDFGFPLLVKKGVEADDVIGSLAAQAIDKGMKVIISTGDKDFAQLVTKDITLINTMTGSTLNQAGVQQKFGVPPEKIIDYLALMGDNVDNVPGVPKVGPKTAVKWLDKYGSLDEIIKHAAEFTGKVGENLRDSLDFLPLARDLVTIAQDITLEENVEDLKLQPQNRAHILRAVKHLEFRTWSKEFADAENNLETDNDKTPDSDSAKNNLTKEKNINSTKNIKYETITSSEQLKIWQKKLNSAKVFAIDTETTSLNAMQAQLVGISISVKPGEAAYIPLQHLTSAPQLKENVVLSMLKPFLQDKNKTIIGQNIKYDYKVLARSGVVITAPIWDTMIASYILNSSRPSHSLDSLANDLLNYKTITYTEVAGKGAKQICFSKVELDIATQYAAEDADITLRLYDIFNTQLSEQKQLKKVLHDIEFPLLPVLAQMELNGVMLDAALLHQQSRSIHKKLQQLQKIIYNLAGHDFNISSPKQLQEILYTKLKLPVLKKTPKGQPSTAEPVLQKLAEDYDLPKQILSYRSLSKLKSTYTDRLPEQMDPDTERVHTSYWQTGAVTGRLSSTDPNLQNIPIRTAEGRKVRQAFIAPRGYRILAADYSQIELRLMAHFSEDHALLRAFSNEIDVHQATASDIFSVSLDKVSSDMRRKAKAINFGLMYGMSAYGLSQQLQITRAEASEFIDTYFMRYPKVLAYMQQMRELAAKQGYVETLLGRKVYLPGATSKQKMQQAAAERAAINAPLQGTSAEIIKKAMITIKEDIGFSKLRAKMVMQVHDELVFEVHNNDCDAAIKHIVKAMEHAVTLKVPLQVSVGVGMNWDEAH